MLQQPSLITCGYPEVGVANLNPCDPWKLFPRNFQKCYSAKIVPLQNLAPYSTTALLDQGQHHKGGHGCPTLCLPFKIRMAMSSNLDMCIPPTVQFISCGQCHACTWCNYYWNYSMLKFCVCRHVQNAMPSFLCTALLHHKYCIMSASCPTSKVVALVASFALHNQLCLQLSIVFTWVTSHHTPHNIPSHPHHESIWYRDRDHPNLYLGYGHVLRTSGGASL